MSGAHTVVLDVNVVVDAVTSGNSPFVVWPSPPPVSDNPAADCVGALNDAREFALTPREFAARVDAMRRAKRRG